MLYLTTQGSARERGRQHGHALAENAIPRALELSTWGQERPGARSGPPNGTNTQTLCGRS
jgi:hypothetical protein